MSHIREDMDRELWLDAGRIKADFRKVSHAGCFCIALANRVGAEIVTADRHELEPLVDQGVCRALFIR